MKNNLVIHNYEMTKNKTIFFKFNLPEDFLIENKEYYTCLPECAINLIYISVWPEKYFRAFHGKFDLRFRMRRDIKIESDVKYNSLNKTLAAGVIQK